jgi:predicted nucleotidyltransferase
VSFLRREDIVQMLAQYHTQISHLGIKLLAVFGSVARGDDRPDSDIDVLVEFQGPATFDQYMELKFLLEELLGRRVDLVSTRALRP